MNLNNYQRIINNLPKNVRLVTVSKHQSPDNILQVYETGQRIFGENRALELQEKYNFLPKDIQWHFIGHLQTNKIKNIIAFVSLIHSIDSFKLLNEVNKEAQKINRVVDVLLEFHIADEMSKQGFIIDEITEYLNSTNYKELNNINIVGVMGMATFSDDENKIRNEFKLLKSYFDILKENFFFNNDSFKEISMGMSNDYQIAIEEGATLIRIGTAIFADI
ncbi:YggS family pyridoxal phosphate-dependent enzyme [Bacteroidales bacterium OttesenSCG-928-K03]|nr:YggS family pyridoxal phosphate-dependent enzyme [Odoribacter sp. OttesenSCG-928-L07]MDL2242598.1 YggS family pyridoxal phosphate-dependent enzyme [Bacteroidales bacterium OttesenSCG-928-K03]